MSAPNQATGAQPDKHPDFDAFMRRRFPSFDLEKSEMTVNGTWLRGFWSAAQFEILKDMAARMESF
jgi:hypothetical protein